MEELEILVNANIGPAAKEIKRLTTQIKQQVGQAVEQAQKAMEQINMQKVADKVQQGIQLIKDNIENLRESTKNDELAITVNNEEASKQISQIEKEIDSLQKKVSENQFGLEPIGTEIIESIWNYNGNGDVAIQNLVTAFGNLLIAINNVAKSNGFQEFLKLCSDKFREISEKMASIEWQPLINSLVSIGESIGTVALEMLNGLTEVFKWLVEHPDVAEFLLAIGVAIGVVSTAIRYCFSRNAVF